MNTVIDLTDLSPRVVDDPFEITRLRWFQVNRYVEAGLLDDIPLQLPTDPDEARSTYFGVYGGGEIHATARIVRGTTDLPMLEHHVLFADSHSQLDALAGSVAEVSRLAVGRSMPRHRALLLLSREFLHFGLRNQHATTLIASVEEPLVRILNRLLGVPLQVIGPPIDKYGSYNGECVPIRIDTIQCLQNFRRQQGRYWEFFMQDAVIDLTDTRASIVETLDSVQVAS